MVRVIALLVACLLGSGCFVFDEIDSGMASMNKNKPAAAAKAKPGEPPTPASEAWWAKARSIDRLPADADAASDPSTPVTCKIRGATRFMRRGDCLSQGGQPAS